MLNHGLLFQVYGEGAAWQFLGWILVFACLVLANEIARRTKVGGMLCFVVLPIILTVYFTCNLPFMPSSFTFSPRCKLRPFTVIPASGFQS